MDSGELILERSNTSSDKTHWLYLCLISPTKSIYISSCFIEETTFGIALCASEEKSSYHLPCCKQSDTILWALLICPVSYNSDALRI